SLKAYDMPEGVRHYIGMARANLLNLAGHEKINAVILISEYEPDMKLVFVTQSGISRRTKCEHFKNIRKTGLIAIELRDDDELISVRKTYGEEELIIVTAKGMAIRFKEEDVRQMGRTAMGVKGINLNKKDEVVGMDLVEEGKDLLVISKNGYGKRTPLD